MSGLRGVNGNPAAPPYTNGPYIMDQHVTFSGGIGAAMTQNDTWYVDGSNGSDSNNGKSWSKAYETIQAMVTAAGAGDVIYIAEKTLTDYTGDPTSYAETITIPYAKSNLSLIGIGKGRTQGGLPQIKKGSGSTALLTIQAPGCLIANMGINGYGATGGGILLDDDYATKAAFGTSILNCHLKNCIPSTATNAATGGAIYTTSAGNAWQVLIAGNRFYKNVGDVSLVGTSNTQPQDWVIENNIFSGPAANVDCNLFLSGAGDGINGVIIRKNEFQCWPALSSGVNNKPLSLTGCVGLMSKNTFGCTGKTFGAAGDAYVPTTVLMAENYQEDAIITRT